MSVLFPYPWRVTQIFPFPSQTDEMLSSRADTVSCHTTLSHLQKFVKTSSVPMYLDIAYHRPVSTAAGMLCFLHL